MPQESLSLESSKVTPPATPGWQGSSLRVEVCYRFRWINSALGCCVIGIVYYLTVAPCKDRWTYVQRQLLRT